MINLFIGIVIGIFIAEMGGTPILQEYLTDLLNSFNELKED